MGNYRPLVAVLVVQTMQLLLFLGSPFIAEDGAEFLSVPELIGDIPISAGGCVSGEAEPGGDFFRNKIPIEYF